MRKHLAAAILVLLAAIALCAGASANSWGLKGKLYNAVEQSKAWEDYTVTGNQEGPFAVMKSRYHNALFCVDNQDRLHVYTTAVYQPDDGRKAPKLYWDGHYMTIAYGDDESYTFCEWEEGSGEFQLSDARIGNFYVSGIPGDDGFSWHYQAADNAYSEPIVLPERIMLSNFNISLFPRSTAEIRHRNYMRARFDSGLNIPGSGTAAGEPADADHPGELLQLKQKGTVPVYSAPYGDSAWRAGNGKAAAGLNGDIWLLSRYKNESGRSYACIRYNVSGRTQRIGYALCGDLGLPEVTEQETDPGHTFVRIPVAAAADTFLTDDPDVSQYRQLEVPKGTRFTCLGLYSNEYAYVSAEVKDGRFTAGSTVVWGFVPVRDLEPVETERAADIAEALAGDWMLEAGGSLAEEVLRFRADGTFTTEHGDEDVAPAGADSGTWYVTKYDPSMNLYWNQPPCEITLLYDNGRASVLGLTVTDDGFGLSFWEGGAGYIPYGETEYEEDANG